MYSVPSWTFEGQLTNNTTLGGKSLFTSSVCVCMFMCVYLNGIQHHIPPDDPDYFISLPLILLSSILIT